MVETEITKPNSEQDPDTESLNPKKVSQEGDELLVQSMQASRMRNWYSELNENNKKKQAESELTLWEFIGKDNNKEGTTFELYNDKKSAAIPQLIQAVVK